MQFIKFHQADPDYRVPQAEVVVSVGQIVKIEPRYYQTGPDGADWLTQVTRPNLEEISQGTQRHYVVHDSLGNRYSSATASEEGRGIIEKIWMEAK